MPRSQSMAGVGRSLRLDGGQQDSCLVLRAPLEPLKAATEMTKPDERVAFVTVGTTRFDALIQVMTTPDALTTLALHGFTHLLLQVGASPEPTVGTVAATADVKDLGEQKRSTGTPHLRRRPTRSSETDSTTTSSSSNNKCKDGGSARGEVVVSWYRYKDSLRADMEAADLIISHAGAGSVMEALDLGKALLVVVNTGLMDDHQQELARAMEEEGYLVATEPQRVLESLRHYHQWHVHLKPRPPPTPGLLPALLDHEMGFRRRVEGKRDTIQGREEDRSRRQSGRLRGSGGGGGGDGDNREK